MRMLLVEDDILMGQAIETGLTRAGYNVEWVKDGETALETAQVYDFGAVALDINLPGKNGLQVLQGLRKRSHVPVVVMTARDGLEDRLHGLDLGADDYLVKPFDMKELLARLRAVIRRSAGRSDSLIRSKDIVMNTAARTVEKAGQPLKLTNREYQILNLLMERMGRIQSRQDIEDQIYSWADDIESNAIEVTIYGLRKKLGKDFVDNIRGVGYVMTP